MSTEKPKQLHWTQTRTNPIDRTKRVAPGCEIKTENIITSTRERKDYDYSLNHLNKFNQLTTVDDTRPSKNMLEKREKGALKQITNNMSSMKISQNQRRRKSITKDQKPKETPIAYESDEEKEAVVEPVEEEAQSTTPVKSRANRQSTGRRKSIKSDQGLPESVVEALKKLGAKLPAKTDDRAYRGKFQLPTALNLFGRIQWPKDIVFAHEELELSSLEFVETDLAEADTIPFLKKHADYYIVADGDQILVALLSENQDVSDFEVYIVDEEMPKPEGPYKISEIISGLTVQEDQE